MKAYIRYFVLFTVVIEAAFFGAGLIRWQDARAGHPYGSGTCVGVGPVNCRATWGGVDSVMRIRTIDNWSWGANHWASGAHAANNSWNNLGPIYASYSPQTNDSWVYQHLSYNGQHGLDWDIYGVTQNCDSSNYCTTAQWIAKNTLWTDTWFNSSDPAMTVPYVIQWIFAHEMGHAVGLGHHDTNNALMREFMTTSNGTLPNGPVQADLGTYGCPGSSSSWGVRCVYGWWRS
jgi:hypothetical protein